MKLLTFLIVTFIVSASGEDLKFEPDLSYNIPTQFSKGSSKARKGGTFFMDLSSNPENLNWLFSTDTYSSQILLQIFESLMDVDDDNLNELPLLANSYQISKDRLFYKFFLNPKAAFSDGTPLTAEDVKWTFDTIKNPAVNAIRWRAIFKNIESARVIDKHTILFKAVEPYWSTYNVLAHSLKVLPKHYYEKSRDLNNDGELNRKPLGSGALMLEEYTQGVKIVLKRNWKYWGDTLKNREGWYNFDKWHFRIINNPLTAYEMFKKNEISFYTFSPEQWFKFVTDKDKEFFKAGKNVKSKLLQNKTPHGFTYIGWNLKNQIFSNKENRYALSQFVNIPLFNQKFFYNHYIQAYSPFGSRSMFSDQSLIKELIGFDIRKGIAILKANGWKDSDGDNILDNTIEGKKVDFKFTVLVSASSEASSKMMVVYKEDLKKAGIVMDIKVMEWTSLLKILKQRNFDAVALSWSGSLNPDPYAIWHSDNIKEGGNNFVSYSNPEVDALIMEAKKEFDINKRAAILKKINRFIYKDQPYTFLVEDDFFRVGYDVRISSEKWSYEYDYAPFEEMWFEGR